MLLAWRHQYHGNSILRVNTAHVILSRQLSSQYTQILLRTREKHFEETDTVV